jgi:demethylspheroidene O-methyltransferase
MDMGTSTDPTLVPNAVSADERLRLFDSLLGFFDIKILASAIRHKLPPALASGPVSIAQLAERVGLPERSLRFFLVGLGGIGLVSKDANGYALAPAGRRYLLEESPYYQGWYIRYWDWVATAAARLDEGLVNNAPVWEGFNHYLNDGSESSREKIQIFNEAMTASQLFVAHSVLEQIDRGGAMRGRTRLLDIGGSYGRFSASAVSRFTGLRATVFDLPPVAKRAKEQLTAWGLADRVDTIGGDFLVDPWPTGHDVVSFIRILNSRSEDVIDHCLKKTFEYLPSGGVIILADAPILPPPSGELPKRQASRLSLLYFMASAGDVRSSDEWAVLLQKAGFAPPETIAFDDPYGVVVARKL